MRMTVLLAVCLCAVLGCSTGRGGQADDTPLVMVTIEPMRYFTEQIAGDLVRVECMVPKGSNPETYDPTPQQMVRLSQSTVYLNNGGYLGFEVSWLERLEQNASDTRFCDLSEGLDLIADGDEAAGIDPHIWNSCANARVIAGNIKDALVQVDPVNADVYREGYRRLMAEIDSTDSVIRAEVAAVAQPRAFLIFHPALTYYAREYGLKQISIEKDGKEPSAAQLRDIIDEGRHDGAGVIFIQPEFDHHNAEAIAREIHAQLVDINPLSYDWSGEMIAIARALSIE